MSKIYYLGYCINGSFLYMYNDVIKKYKFEKKTLPKFKGLRKQLNQL